jgi:hypothetical protein
VLQGEPALRNTPTARCRASDVLPLSRERARHDQFSGRVLSVLPRAAVIYSLDKTLLQAGKVLDLPVSMGIRAK